MNRYPVWKFVLMALAVLIGLLYTVPNLYGSAPAVQVSAASLTTKVGTDTATQVEQLLAAAAIKPDYVTFEGTTVHARFATTDTQIHARDVINAGLNAGADKDAPPYSVALNMVPRAPRWMASLHALPMYLGLDLRGGVHFLLQVDLKAALDKKIEALVTDTRTTLREKQLRAAVDARRQFRHDDLPRRRHRHAGGQRAHGRVPVRAVDVRGGRCRRARHRRAQAGRTDQGPGPGHQAEHDHAGQPRGRPRHVRARDPAAGRRPHRRRAAGHPGHRQGARADRAHGHAVDPHGRPDGRRLRGQPGRRRVPEQPRHRAAQRPDHHRQEGSDRQRRRPGRRPTQLRQPEQRRGRQAADERQGRAQHARGVEPTTSAS
jgi:hypothetical protein